MNTDKQIDKLHDALREILDPEGYGWINKSTEVVIDDLIMAGVSIGAEAKITSLEIKLENEDKKWREMWADNQRQWEAAYDDLEAEVTEQDEAILRALKHMGECRREGKVEAVEKMKHKLWLEYSDCYDEEQISVGSLRENLELIAKEVLEGE